MKGPRCCPSGLGCRERMILPPRRNIDLWCFSIPATNEWCKISRWSCKKKLKEKKNLNGICKLLPNKSKSVNEKYSIHNTETPKNNSDYDDLTISLSICFRTKYHSQRRLLCTTIGWFNKMMQKEQKKNIKLLTGSLESAQIIRCNVREAVPCSYAVWNCSRFYNSLFFREN